jgi:hypothetical protein
MYTFILPFTAAYQYYIYPTGINLEATSWRRQQGVAKYHPALLIADMLS